MSTNKIIGIIVGVLALCFLVVVGAIGLFFYHASQDVEGVVVNIDSPKSVRIGDTFDLKVVVKNERKKDELQLTDIDIGEIYLKGFLVESITPTHKGSLHVPIDNSQSYTFDTDIPAGEARTFVFTLRAERTGVFRGDVDVCEGTRFITATAQTSVRRAKGQAKAVETEEEDDE